MKDILYVILFYLGSATLVAQSHLLHELKSDESLSTVARYYKVTIQDLELANNTIISRLKAGDTLVIPRIKSLQNTNNEIQDRDLIFKIHKVRRKETIYSICKKYAISELELKTHNSDLKNNEYLSTGARLFIPKYAQIRLANTLKTYMVLSNDSILGIAQKFDISTDELFIFNPTLKIKGISEGLILVVPNITELPVSSTITTQWSYYTVQPKEGYYRISKKLGRTKEELIKLNPFLATEGLKPGMRLRFSKIFVADSLAAKSFSLIDSLKNFKTKKLALVMPFKLHKFDFDSIQQSQRLILKDGYINISTDFYFGVLMALDSVKQLGLSVTLDVFDSEGNVSKIKEHLTTNNFSQYDAVLGTLSVQNLEFLSSQLESEQIPVFSPFVKVKNPKPNLFQTLPSNTQLRLSLLNHVQKDSLPKQILIISDSHSLGSVAQIKTIFPNARHLVSKKDSDGAEQFHVVKDDLMEILGEGETLVFLESTNAGLVSNVSSMLNGLNGDTELEDSTIISRSITLTTTQKNKAFDVASVSKMDLSQLSFFYTSSSSINLKDELFFNQFRKRFNAFPSKYAVRGFDLSLDILLRLASTENDLYSNYKHPTKFVENKFSYDINKDGVGYTNNAFYLLQYDGLILKELQ